MKNIKLSKHIAVVSEDDSVLLFSYVSGILKELDASTYAKIKQSPSDLPGPLIEELISDCILVEDDEYPKPNKDSIPNQLKVVIMPNDKCNLHCTYCGQNHGGATIEQDILESLLAWIKAELESHSYKCLHIGWFGGEPTLSIDQIMIISDDLIDYCQKHEISYSAEIVSNGRRLRHDEYENLVGRCRISYWELTCDGDRKHHNLRRLNKRKQGFFDDVIASIDTLLRIDKCQVSVRCNVDEENIEGIPRLIDTLANMPNRSRLRFYMAPIHAWGSESGTRAIDVPLFAKVEMDMIKHMKESGLDIIGLLSPHALHPYSCMINNVSSYVVDCNGVIYPCGEMPYTSDSLYGRYVIGNVRDAGLKPRQKHMGDNAMVPKECAACPIEYICPRCPRLEDEGHQRVCISLKYNYVEKVKLLYDLCKSFQYSEK